MKYIKLILDNLDIKPNSEIKGHITVDYPGAYDGIVINTLIMNSNELIVYKYIMMKKFLIMFHGYLSARM